MAVCQDVLTNIDKKSIYKFATSITTNNLTTTLTNSATSPKKIIKNFVIEINQKKYAKY